MTKKITVILISLIAVISFLALVYYGARYNRGIPVAIEKLERSILDVPFIDRDIDFNKGISQEIWDTLAAKEIKLMYQVMVLPWPKAITPEVTVKTFYNKKDIYFYLSWKDDTENRNIGIDKFSDATAILFPMDEKAQPPTLLMGFLGRANIWQWKATQDREFWKKETEESKAYADFYYPFEEEETLVVSKDIPKSAANDLMAIRVGTITPKEVQNVEARGEWSKGVWQVVFKRAFKAVDSEIDAVFNPGKRLCAFAVWNGEKGDRGGRKSISDWVELEIK